MPAPPKPPPSSPVPPAAPAGAVPLASRLQALFPEASRQSRKEWLARGRVTVDGVVVRDGRTPIAPSARIALGRATVPVVPFPRALHLVHEDDDLLVLEKPPDLLTIATESNKRGRTVYRLVWDYLAAARPPRRPFIVHRLDRETSGLLVIAKSPQAKTHLQAQFAARTVERGYVAVVEGRVAAAAGTLEDRLVQDRALRVRVARPAGRTTPRTAGPGRDSGAPAGRLAVTRYRVHERRPQATVLDLALETGRRRQIRVQLAALGHPIAGDRDHGAATDPIGRLVLHAATLGFVHPTSAARLRFTSAPPAAFGRIGRGTPAARRPIG